MKRRDLLAGLAALPAGSAASGAVVRRNSALPPRKVVLGTAMQAYWETYPGLENRLARLTALVDRMAAQAQARHGRGLDLAILPEAAVTGESGGDALSHAVPFEGMLGDTFARKAREHRCYIVVPTYLREAGDPRRCSNAAVLVGRDGKVAGIYRKVHLVVGADGKTMEGGSTPGSTVPVFDCDFGKLGIQICYDMEFDRGWQELEKNGAEIVAWPTQSPQTVHPAARAMQQRCYIVSSTWRHNATVFEPTGKVAAQILPPEEVLVHELDLSYAILPWSSKLKGGRALKELYGDRVGFRYYDDEDCGLFWSNDTKTPIARMAATLGVLEAEEQLAQVREAYRRARVLDY